MTSQIYVNKEAWDADQHADSRMGRVYEWMVYSLGMASIFQLVPLPYSMVNNVSLGLDY